MNRKVILVLDGDEYDAGTVNDLLQQSTNVEDEITRVVSYAVSQILFEPDRESATITIKLK